LAKSFADALGLQPAARISRRNKLGSTLDNSLRIRYMDVGSSFAQVNPGIPLNV
jgi:hypothetical protein